VHGVWQNDCVTEPCSLEPRAGWAEIPGLAAWQAADEFRVPFADGDLNQFPATSDAAVMSGL